MKIRNLSTAIVGFLFFTILCGFRGCHVSTQVSGPAYEPAPAGHVVVNTSPAPAPVVYTGDVELSVYKPLYSPMTPETYSFNVTVRRGGAFGAIELQIFDYGFDTPGIGVLDINGLLYGFYDIEVVGLDMFGNSVSYAAQSIVVDEPLAVLALELEPVIVSGDVMLDIFEPDNGMYSGPIDTIDYVLWERDPMTNQLVLVEHLYGLKFDPWNPLVIGSLALSDYTIEITAYDVFGLPVYSFSGDFAHSDQATYLPVPLWYY